MNSLCIRSLSLVSSSLLALACSSGDATELDAAQLEQEPFGTLALSLSSTNEGEVFRLVGSLSVLNAAAQVVATVDAALDSPPTHSVVLEPGSYGVSIADGYFCTYSGPNQGFTGCTFVRATPNPFEIASGGLTPVTLEVTLHFEPGQDVTALFRTGAAEFRLAPSVELAPRCGQSPACGSGQLCASLDGGAARCQTPCASSADCNGAECVSVFASPPGGAAPTGVCASSG